MRVLHFYSGNQFGGVESFLCRIQLNADLWDGAVHRFVLCFEGKLSARLRELGAQVDILPAPRLSRPWTWIKSSLGLRQMALRHRADHVIAHDFWSLAVGCWAVRLKLRYWVHTVQSGWHALFEHFLVWILSPRAVVVASPYLESRVRLQIKYPKIERWMIPVLRELPGARPILSAGDPSLPVVLVLSRIERAKGVHHVIAACAQLKAKGILFRLKIVGGASTAEGQLYLRELSELAQSLGVESQIDWVGHVDDPQPYFLQATVFCHAGESPETLAMSCIEALSYGLPVVAVDRGGAVVELLHGLEASGVTQDLAQALERVLKSQDLQKIACNEGPTRAMAIGSAVKAFEKMNLFLRGQ